MARTPQTTSSGSDNDGRYATMDEKKRKRMISNRESARRSRLKKQKQMEDMIREISTLERKIKENNDKCRFMSQTLTTIESENKFLMSEKKRLTNYLAKLEKITEKSTQDSDQNAESAVGDCRRTWPLGFSVGSDGFGSLQPAMSYGLFKT
ncbi:PREDICTED: basic leucine zipper 1 [Tarenaya hassleriana]|uniref:basic leucine zipper 1 n=1 Tax=Tarenaya hassleriana TaxID=28532 RepID=UPI00053C765D|nr:PREDICTED: basic leucine zipper 1 [Tarenaya hassleriana]